MHLLEECLEPLYGYLKLSDQVKSELNNKLTPLLLKDPIDEEAILREISDGIPGSSYNQVYVAKKQVDLIKRLQNTQADEPREELNAIVLEHFNLLKLTPEEIATNLAVVNSIFENKKLVKEANEKLGALHNAGISGDDCTLLSVDLSPPPVTDKKNGPFPSGLRVMHDMLTRAEAPGDHTPLERFFSDFRGVATLEMGGIDVKKQFIDEQAGALEIALKEAFRFDSVPSEADNSAENIARLSLVEGLYEFDQALRIKTLREMDVPHLSELETMASSMQLPENGDPFPPHIDIDPLRCFWTRNEKNTIIVRTQIHPIKDEWGTILGYAGVRRETTISNKDLAKSWVGVDEPPPSLKVKTTCVYDCSLSVMREELGLNPNAQGKKEAKPLEAGPPGEAGEAEDARAIP